MNHISNKACGREILSSAGIPKIPNQNSWRWTEKPRVNVEKPNPNSRKGTDNPKHGKQTDTSMCKNQQAQVKTQHSNALGKFKQPTAKLSDQ